MDSTDVMYKLVNCWLIPNLFEARQAYSPSSASVTDSKTRGLEYTFPGPSSICPGFRTVKSWPFKSNVKSVGGLYNVSSTFLNHCEDIRNRKTKLFRHSPIITKLFLKNKQLHSMTGMSFFRYHLLGITIWHDLTRKAICGFECIMSNFVIQIQELQRYYRFSLG